MDLLTTFEGFGTGALPRQADWRDYELAKAPGIAPCLGQAPPADDHLLPSIRGVYNQGNTPSCVAHSFAGLMSIYEQIEQGRWVEMDALRCYRDCGGNGSNGVYSQAVLKYGQQQGMPVLGSGARYKIEAYAFANPFNPVDIEAVKTAIWQGRPCKLAMLLPSDFNSGMNAGGTAPNPQAYHEVCAVGYTGERVIYLNSWGSSFGNNGLGSVPWSFLAHPAQRNYSYFYTTIDAKDDGTPDPAPVPPPPPPPPSPFTVTSYLDVTPNVQAYKAGQIISPIGTGFDVGVLQARLSNGEILAVEERAPTLLRIRLPRTVAEPIAARVVLQREGEVKECPWFMLLPNGSPAPTPDPKPQPDPQPGGLTLEIKPRKILGLASSWTVSATVHEADGKVPAAVYTGRAADTLLAATSRPANYAAQWQVKAPEGTTVTVQATTSDGRSVTGSKVLASA